MTGPLPFEACFERAQHVEGWSQRAEHLWLYTAATKVVPPGGLWIEIGTWKGRSMIPTIGGLPSGATFLAIDPHRNSLERKAHVELDWEPDWVHRQFMLSLDMARTMRPDLIISHLRMESAHAVRLLRDQSADAVFIDGAHDKEGVYLDASLYSTVVHPEGLLCGHDAGNKGVQEGLKKAGISYTKTGAGSIWVRT